MAVTRTIYLPTKQDLDLYNKAKEIAAKEGDSVSNYVIKALNQYMNHEPNGKVNFPTYILYVGESKQMEKKKFYGLYLASEIKKEENEEKEVQIYITKKDNIIVYQRTRDLNTSFERADYQVYDSLDDVQNISQKLYHVAKEKLEIKEVEFLDI